MHIKRRIKLLENLTSWRAVTEISRFKAWQCFRVILWCLLMWLVMNVELQHARIQQVLKSPWHLQALNLAPPVTISLESWSKYAQQYLRMMNESRKNACVCRILEKKVRENFENFWKPRSRIGNYDETVRIKAI